MVKFLIKYFLSLINNKSIYSDLEKENINKNYKLRFLKSLNNSKIIIQNLKFRNTAAVIERELKRIKLRNFSNEIEINIEHKACYLEPIHFIFSYIIVLHLIKQN